MLSLVLGAGAWESGAVGERVLGMEKGKGWSGLVGADEGLVLTDFGVLCLRAWILCCWFTWLGSILDGSWMEGGMGEGFI